MSSHIRDINLWESGAQKIVWVRNHMPLLDSIEQEFLKTKPFAGLKIALTQRDGELEAIRNIVNAK